MREQDWNEEKKEENIDSDSIHSFRELFPFSLRNSIPALIECKANMMYDAKNWLESQEQNQTGNIKIVLATMQAPAAAGTGRTDLVCEYERGEEVD